MHAKATPARANRESLRPNATYYLWALVPTLAGCTVTARWAGLQSAWHAEKRHDSRDTSSTDPGPTGGRDAIA